MIIGLQEPHEYHLSAVLHPVSYYMGVHLFRMDDGRNIYRLLWCMATVTRNMVYDGINLGIDFY